MLLILDFPKSAFRVEHNCAHIALWVVKMAVGAKKKSVVKTPTPRERLDAFGIDALCAFISAGNSLNEFGRVYDFCPATVDLWIENPAFPERASQYARARERRADKYVEEIITIADDGRNDTYTDENGKERTDWDVVARSKLRVDARKWVASKMHPRKYGDRTILAGDPEAPLSGAKPDLSKLTNEELQTLTLLQRKIEGDK